MKTVLIVDDDPHICKMLGHFLETAGYATDRAGDGEEACLVLAGVLPDVVILDMNMPKLDGAGVLKNIRENSLKTRVIIASGYMDEAKVAALAPLVPDAYLNKPFRFSDLIATIERVTADPGPGPVVTS